MANVLILGGTGTLGSALSRYLIENTDFDLTLFARHAKEKAVQTERVRVVDGDATNVGDLDVVLPQSDAVVCAVSGPELPKVAKALVSGMEAHGPKRLVFMGAVGIYDEIPEEMDGKDNVSANPDQIPNRKAVDVVEASSLDWTVLRPGYLQDGDADDFTLSVKCEPAKGCITTIPSIVHLIARLLEDPSLYLRESVSITKDMR